MHRWFLVGAIVLLAAAVTCVTVTVIGMANGEFGFSDTRFWAMVAFHPITALAGAFLLEQAVRGLKAAEAADEQQEAES